MKKGYTPIEGITKKLAAVGYVPTVEVKESPEHCFARAGTDKRPNMRSVIICSDEEVESLQETEQYEEGGLVILSLSDAPLDNLLQIGLRMSPDLIRIRKSVVPTGVTRVWRVYGYAGREQKASYGPSVRWDWSNAEDGIRIFEAENADKTNTHEYTIVRITRNTAVECAKELMGQVSDGYFENVHIGKTVEMEVVPDEGTASA